MARPSGTHESFDREEDVKGSSDRSFGLVFAGVFAVIGGIKLWAGSSWSWPWLVASGLMLSLALALPGVLAPANRLWLRFGLLLHRIVNPLVMGLLFFLTVTPLALVLRLMGKDLLRLRRDRSTPSYWIVRTPPGPSPDSMINQF